MRSPWLPKMPSVQYPAFTPMRVNEGDRPHHPRNGLVTEAHERDRCRSVIGRDPKQQKGQESGVLRGLEQSDESNHGKARRPAEHGEDLSQVANLRNRQPT